MPTFEQLSAFVVVFLAVCCAITTVSSAFGAVQKWRKPGLDMAATVEEHGRYLDNDNRRLIEQRESIALLIRGQMQLITHEIDGNHVEKLREVRDEMEQYLINR